MVALIGGVSILALATFPYEFKKNNHEKLYTYSMTNEPSRLL
jgi:hypothetical protein